MRLCQLLLQAFAADEAGRGIGGAADFGRVGRRDRADLVGEPDGGRHRVEAVGQVRVADARVRVPQFGEPGFERRLVAADGPDTLVGQVVDRKHGA